MIVRDIANKGIETEWDVQSCGSFLKDQGKWQRLCPGKKLPT